jgi:F0F1-type ATP synthase membrane subunit b/b'
MLEDAEKKARQMIEEENIVRRARVESEEIREKAQQETAQLRKNTMDFVDQQLMEADRSISEMLNAIRLERNEVRNRR